MLNPKLAGGAMLDTGIYPVALIQDFIREEPVNFKAIADMSATGVDKSSMVIMDFDSGKMAQFFTSFGLRTKWSAVLYGTEGWIELFNFFRCVKLNVRRGDENTLIEEPFTSTGFYHEIEAAINDIRAGRLENEIMSHADSLMCARMMDRAIQQFNN